MIKGVITLSEYLSATRLFTLKCRPIHYIIFSIFLPLVVIIYFWFSLGITWGVFFIFFFILAQVLLFFKACRNFRKRKDLTQETEASWDETGMSFRSSFGSGTRLWSSFESWHENAKVFILPCSGSRLFIIIPKSYFQNEELLIFFRNILREKIKK